MPASSIRSRSSGWPLAVMATIGMRGAPAAASRRRISRAVAGPSSRGIMPSTSSRSNGSAARRSSASAPLATVTTSRPRAASWPRAIRR